MSFGQMGKVYAEEADTTITIDDVVYQSNAALQEKEANDPAKDEYVSGGVTYNVTPNVYQYEYMKDELAAFCHFGPNTFNNIEWGEHYGTRPPSDIFPLKEFDAEPMVRTLKEAGFTKLVVTAKHHDGFCIWDSEFTEYDTAAAGAPDVLEKLSQACTKYDMDMGLYLSPWDIHDESYGYKDAAGNPLVNSNGTPINGKNFENFALEGDAKDYNEYYDNQLKEILGNNEKYGNHGVFKEVWMDGAKGSGSSVQHYDFKRWFNTINELETENCMLFGAEAYTTVRWIGNESGYANELTWAKSTVDFTRNTINSNRTGAQSTYIGFKNGNAWTVPEVDCRITSGWFWGPGKKSPKTLSQLGDFYFNSVGHNGVLLLNVPPNDEGRNEGSASGVDAEILARVQEFGDALKNTFGENGYGRNANKEENKGKLSDRNLIAGATIYADSVRDNNVAYGPANLMDNNQDTYWAVDDSDYEGKLYVKLPESRIFDVVSLEEAIQFGQRITNFTIEYKNGNSDEWKVFGEGTTIGAKRLVREAAVRADRLRITVSTGNSHNHYNAPERDIPILTEIGLYKAAAAFESGTKIPSGMQYTDCREFVPDDRSKWRDESGNHFVGGTSMYSVNNNVTSVSFDINGSKFYLVGTKDPNHGDARIYIDGELVDTFGTYASSRSTGVMIYESPDLTPRLHTVKVESINKPVAVDGVYYISNSGRGLIDIEKSNYVMYEDSTIDVKIKRTGGFQGKITGVLEPNPGTAIQDDFDTTPIPFTIPAGQKEVTVQVSTRRNENSTGDQDFTIELTRGEADGSAGYIIGFTDIATVTIVDTESFDPQELRSRIDEASAYSPEAYTADSYAELLNAINKADVAINGGDLNKIVKAYVALNKAIELLEGVSINTSNPFSWPSEAGEENKVILEAETAFLHNVMEDATERWQLEVANGEWASGGQFINCFNKNDRIVYPYYAEKAGTYKFTVTYRSGSNNNSLVWSEPSKKLRDGETSAGHNNAGETRTTEFTVEVTTPGIGYLTFTAPNGDSPQLDKFEIQLVSENEAIHTVSAEIVGVMGGELNPTQPIKVVESGDVAFTVLAKDGYDVSKVTVDGVLVYNDGENLGSSSSGPDVVPDAISFDDDTNIISILNITKSHEVVVEFAKSTNYVVESFDTITESVDAGIIPQLPSKVTGHLANGTQKVYDVVWTGLTEEKMSVPGTYYIYGDVNGSNRKPLAVITVIGVVSVESPRVYTTKGAAPQLPSTVTAKLNNNTSVEIPVAWDTVSDDIYNSSDSAVRISGSVEALGYSGTVEAIVGIKNVEVEGAAIISRNSSPSTQPLPAAFANYFTGDLPERAINGVTSYSDWSAGGNKVCWNDWVKNQTHPENNWMGVVLNTGTERSIINQADIWWLDEGNGATERVTVPQSYVLEYYVGPDLAVTDFERNRKAIEWSGQMSSSPLKDDNNWHAVTLIEADYPALPEYRPQFSDMTEDWKQMQSVSFEPVITQALRVKVVPQLNCWVGIYEFDVKGKQLEFNETVEPESVQLLFDGVACTDTPIEENGVKVINKTLDPNDPLPTILAACEDPSVKVTVINSNKRNGTVKVIFTPESGENELVYEIRLVDPEEKLVKLGDIAWNVEPAIGMAFDITDPSIDADIELLHQNWEIQENGSTDWKTIQLHDEIINANHNGAKLRFTVTYQLGGETKEASTNILDVNVSAFIAAETVKLNTNNISAGVEKEVSVKVEPENATYSKVLVNMVDRGETGATAYINSDGKLCVLARKAGIITLEASVPNGRGIGQPLVVKRLKLKVIPADVPEGIEQSILDKEMKPENFEPVVRNPYADGAYDLETDGIKYDTDYYYTGQPITPTIEVWDNGVKLVAGVDYTVSYKNNKLAWIDKNNPRFAEYTGISKYDDKKRPTIVIKGKGSYTNNRDIYFNILPLDIASLVPDNSNHVMIMNGKNKPVPTIYNNGVKLTVKNDFDVEYAKDLKSATVKGKGNYTGTINYNVETVTGNLKDVSKLSITIKAKDITYNGKNVELSKEQLIVKDKAQELTLGTDYQVAYVGNDRAGKATVIISAMPNSQKYVGSVSKTFAIAGKDLAKSIFNNVKLNAKETFVGTEYPITIKSMSEANKALITERKVTYGDKEILLKEGIDGHYIATYKNNNKVGKASVTLTGTGKDGVTGKVTLNYTIVSPTKVADNANAEGIYAEIIDKDHVKYVKGGATPEVKVVYNLPGNSESVVLTKGVDYTVKYNTDKIKTTGNTKAQILFKGNYKDVKLNESLPYTIERQDINIVSMVVADLEEGKKVTSAPKPVVTDVNGKKLATPADYKVSYSVNGSDFGSFNPFTPSKEMIGKIKVKITGEGAYTGEQIFEVHVGEKNQSINKARMKKTIKKSYTGNAIYLEKDEVNGLLAIGSEPVPYVGRMSDGDAYALAGIDDTTTDGYYIYSYSRNVAKGKMTVVLRGIGKYYGSKTINISISAKSMKGMYNPINRNWGENLLETVRNLFNL